MNGLHEKQRSGYAPSVIVHIGTRRKSMGRKRDISAYRSWQNMKTRCYNRNRPKTQNYIDNGITVCSRWLNSFGNFYEDMGERPEGTTIERIDNYGNYEPLNCKWATNKEQGRNRCNNRTISYNGKKQCLSAWCEELNIDYLKAHRLLRHHPFSYVITISITPL